MENIIIHSSSKTPQIDFNATSGVLEISGRSIPENSVEFYRPILDWLEEYISLPAEKTSFIFKLEYFNTSSSKCILDIFRKLEKIVEKESSHSVSVSWFFDEDDEDMQESGEDFQEIIKLPFKMLEIKDED